MKNYQNILLILLQLKQKLMLIYKRLLKNGLIAQFLKQSMSLLTMIMKILRIFIYMLMKKDLKAVQHLDLILKLSKVF